MRGLLKWLVIFIVSAGLIYVGIWYLTRDTKAPVELRTAKVTRGNLLTTISATGTLEPEEAIDVGAQVAGQIISFGIDNKGNTIDNGSVMEKGAIIAKIDDAIYAADVTESQAQLEQAKAGVAKANADLVSSRSKLDQAQRDWDRAQKLGPSDALAQSAYDNYRAIFEQAKAAIGVGEAALVQANATVAQADSSLSRAKRNLGYCTIYAPVSGTVIIRRVNIGQTVVSSLNAPSLFLLATDLKRMEVWVAVNEADVGNIHPDQPVTFSVDAFPGTTFKGVVKKVRLDASMTQNVVSYTVEVLVDNADNKLLPYLTANVQFEVARAEDALLVPNAALRWTPSEAQVSPEAKAASAKVAANGEADAPAGDRSRGGRSRDASVTSATTGPTAGSTAGPTTMRSGDRTRSRQAVLWVRDGAFVKPIRVMAGITDGVQTVVRGEDVKEDLDIVVGEAVAQTAGAAGSTNPFLPQFPRRNGGGGGGGNRGGGG